MRHSVGPRLPAWPELSEVASDLLDALCQPPIVAALALLATLLLLRLVVVVAAGGS